MTSAFTDWLNAPGLSPQVGVLRCELVEAAGAAAAPVPFAGHGPGPGPCPGLGSGLFPVGRKWLGCTGLMLSGPRGRDNEHTPSLKTAENQKKKSLQLQEKKGRKKKKKWRRLLSAGLVSAASPGPGLAVFWSPTVYCSFEG